MAQTSSTPPLMVAVANLPPELRAIIFDYALTQDFIVNADTLYALARSDFSYIGTPLPALLQADRPTFTQAFLRANYVGLADLANMYSFIENHESEAGLQGTGGGMQCIRHLFVRANGPLNAISAESWMQQERADILGCCTNVRSITILHRHERSNYRLGLARADSDEGNTLDRDEKKKCVRAPLQGPRLREVRIEAITTGGVENRHAQGFYMDIKKIAAEMKPEVKVMLRRY